MAPPIYPADNVMDYFRDLLDSYYKRDKLNLLSYTLNTMEIDKSLEYFGTQLVSLKYYAQIMDEYKRIFKKRPNLRHINPHHDDRYAMVIFGIGLGYPIQELIVKYNIQHLCLIDLNLEMLRVSLYTLNWKSIFEYFTEKDKHRSLEIIVNRDPKKVETMFSQYLFSKVPMAYYNMAQLVTYRDEKIDDTIKRINEAFSLYTGGSFGFFDDEKWSMQHTLHNLNENIPILYKKNCMDNDTHVFVVANGPSLDKDIEFIKKHRDKAIVIAAGTAFGSLYKNGIKADILIEIEKNYRYPMMLQFNMLQKSALKDVYLYRDEYYPSTCL